MHQRLADLEKELRDRPPTSRRSPSSSGNREPADCFKCGAPGHVKRECPELLGKDGGNQGLAELQARSRKRGSKHSTPLAEGHAQKRVRMLTPERSMVELGTGQGKEGGDELSLEGEQVVPGGQPSSVAPGQASVPGSEDHRASEEPEATGQSLGGAPPVESGPRAREEERYDLDGVDSRDGVDLQDLPAGEPRVSLTSLGQVRPTTGFNVDMVVQGEEGGDAFSPEGDQVVPRGQPSPAATDQALVPSSGDHGTRGESLVSEKGAQVSPLVVPHW